MSDRLTFNNFTFESLKQITKGKEVWNDLKFGANETSMFDKRITKRLEDGTLT